MRSQGRFTQVLFRSWTNYKHSAMGGRGINTDESRTTMSKQLPLRAAVQFTRPSAMRPAVALGSAAKEA